MHQVTGPNTTDTGKEKESLFKKQHLKDVFVDQIDYFLSILLATSTAIAPILSCSAGSPLTVKLHKYDMMLNVYKTI